MINYNDGEIHVWKGGDCPVHPRSSVRVWTRRGTLIAQRASLTDWKHYAEYSHRDVIAFQTTYQYQDLTSYAVVKYKPDGQKLVSYYDNFETANKMAQGYTKLASDWKIRIVKMIEEQIDT